MIKATKEKPTRSVSLGLGQYPGRRWAQAPRGYEHDIGDIDSGLEEARREDGLDIPVGATVEENLPERQEDPADSRRGQGSYDDGASPFPRARSSLLYAKYEEYGCQYQQDVADEVDSAYGRCCFQSAPSFLGPKEGDADDSQSAGWDTIVLC